MGKFGQRNLGARRHFLGKPLFFVQDGIHSKAGVPLPPNPPGVQKRTTLKEEIAFNLYNVVLEELMRE